MPQVVGASRDRQQEALQKVWADFCGPLGAWAARFGLRCRESSFCCRYLCSLPPFGAPDSATYMGPITDCLFRLRLLWCSFYISESVLFGVLEKSNLPLYKSNLHFFGRAVARMFRTSFCSSLVTADFGIMQ